MKIRLGSDLIECLSWSLYENPVVLFREAIQNSIDAFGSTSRDWGKLLISINLNANKREIAFEDNGPGLNEEEFLIALGSLGESNKKSHNYSGCRGIGRLSGLGICDQITFTSKHASSNIESKCIIDAKGIRDGLRVAKRNSELAQFISDYVHFSREQITSPKKNYFNVTYSNVRRLSGDQLLNPKYLENYISCIAPVPLDANIAIFQRLDEIYQKYDLPHSIGITINNGEILTKKLADKKFIETNSRFDYEVHEIFSDNNSLLGVACLIHHDYLGALGPTPFRGLRFRHKNIQVGGEDTFASLFKEPRFNRWAIGEVHALCSSIRPSVKRDDFEPSDNFNLLLYKVRPLLHKIGQLARKSSEQRVQKRKHNQENNAKPYLKKIQNSLSKKLPLNLQKKKAIQIAEDLFLHAKGKIHAKDIIEIFSRRIYK
jgi:molecular chaperone HtpG